MGNDHWCSSILLSSIMPVIWGDIKSGRVISLVDKLLSQIDCVVAGRIYSGKKIR